MEISRGLHSYPVFPPMLRLEPVGGCNRHCSFCGIAQMDTITKMSFRTYDDILANAVDHTDVLKTVGYALHGEPTLHPSLPLFISDMRSILPKAKLMVTTNGDVLLKRPTLDGFEEILEAGADYITLDLYDKEVKEKFEEAAVKSTTFGAKFDILSMYDDNANQFKLGKPKRPCIIAIDDTEGFNTGDTKHREFNTQGGGVDIEQWRSAGLDIATLPILKVCSEPLRHLAIHSNGDCSPCCADGSQSTIVGNVNTDTIEAIWQSEKMNRIRHALKNGRRDAIPSCYACNRTSFRDGLWPYVGPSFDITETARILAEDARLYPRYLRNMTQLNATYPLKNRYLRSRFEK